MKSALGIVSTAAAVLHTFQHGRSQFLRVCLQMDLEIKASNQRRLLKGIDLIDDTYFPYSFAAIPMRIALSASFPSPGCAQFGLGTIPLPGEGWLWRGRSILATGAKIHWSAKRNISPRMGRQRACRIDRVEFMINDLPKYRMPLAWLEVHCSFESIPESMIIR